MVATFKKSHMYSSTSQYGKTRSPIDWSHFMPWGWHSGIVVSDYAEEATVILISACLLQILGTDLVNQRET